MKKLLSFLILTILLTGCARVSEKQVLSDDSELETTTSTTAAAITSISSVSSTSMINTTANPVETTESISTPQQEESTMISTYPTNPANPIETDTTVSPVMNTPSSFVETMELISITQQEKSTIISKYPTNPTNTTIETNTTTEVVSEIVPEDGQLVRILDFIPDAEIDLRYATTNNFTGTVIYDDSEAYLCYGTVKKLISVQNELKEMGYRILIWDAYRSTEAQWKLWETYPDPTFVANPNNGITSHSRGNTIDISLVYEDGSPVEMPSAFDEFEAIADRDYSDVSETAAANSRLLEEVMYRHGFTGYWGEWWDYSDTNQYELIPAVSLNSAK